MKIRRILFLINSLWELLRFLLLFLAAVLVFRKTVAAETQALRWLLVLAAPGLLLPAGFLFLYLDPDRNAALLGVLSIGKVLALCAAAVLLLAAPFELLRRSLSLTEPVLIPLAILTGAAAVDLALLLPMLPHRQGKEDDSAAAGKTR
jgi:hypothetical protein